MKRMSWPDYFMSMAHVAKIRSTCVRRQIGAVAVKDDRILATGYNGAPPNTKHCLDIGCMRDKENIPSGTMHEKCRALHAEQNLIIQAAVHGISLKGCEIYCTNQPCIICMKMIVGIKPMKLVYENSYPDEDTIALLKEVAREDLIYGQKSQKFLNWNFYNWK